MWPKYCLYLEKSSILACFVIFSDIEDEAFWAKPLQQLEMAAYIAYIQ